MTDLLNSLEYSVVTKMCNFVASQELTVPLPASIDAGDQIQSVVAYTTVSIFFFHMLWCLSLGLGLRHLCYL